MSIELQYLIFAVFLVIIQMVLQSTAGMFANGLMGAAGSRDDEVLTTGIGGRFERAYYNMLETFPVFASLVLITEVAVLAGMMERSTLAITAVQLYFWGRVVYVPLYVIAIPFLRTIAWLVSMVGIIMLAWPLLGLVT
jgi:uncharacterized MAPEG superfamily protein